MASLCDYEDGVWSPAPSAGERTWVHRGSLVYSYLGNTEDGKSVWWDVVKVPARNVVLNALWEYLGREQWCSWFTETSLLSCTCVRLRHCTDRLTPACYHQVSPCTATSDLHNCLIVWKVWLEEGQGQVRTKDSICLSCSPLAKATCYLHVTPWRWLKRGAMGYFVTNSP